MPTTSARARSSRAHRVSVQIAVARRGVPSAASLRKWALGHRGTTLRVVGEREGRQLNRRFRKIDRATNVLSFSYAKDHGDVVLCHPVIVREARDQGKSIAAHYAHLVVHGVLHLQGHDHNGKREAQRMARAERRLLARLGFGDPYAVKSPLPR